MTTPPLRAALAALALATVAAPLLAQQPATPRLLRIGHQFTASTNDEGDFRDRLCRKFAAEVERLSNGTIRCEIHAANALVKPEQQLGALQKGGMEVCLYPLNNGFVQTPELNITLLPGVIKSYEQALRWKTAPIGSEVSKILASNGVVILTWIWQAAGIVALERPVVLPEDLRGLRTRGAGASVDAVLNATGGTVVNMPSSEIAKAFRDRKIDVAITSATSLVAFKLQDFCHAVTTPRIRALFYFPEPLVMAKSTFDALTPEQRAMVQQVGASLEKFALDCAKADDEKLAQTYLSANALVLDMDDEQFVAWQRVARAAAWRDYERAVPRGKELLDMALSVP